MAANDVLGISGQMDITDIQKSFDALIENLNKLGIKTDDVSARMTKAMNNISRGVASNSTQSAESIRQLQSDIAGINNILINTAKFASAAFAGFSVKEVVSTIANVRGEFQQLEIAFGTMLGSEEKATVLMKQLTDLAATTPFDMKGVASGAKSLLAYGFSAEEVTDTMRRLGDVCAGLGLNLQDLAWLYGTTRTQGRLFTQDFRQFTGRGIPLAEELAKQFGVTKDKVQDLVTAGKVGFPEVQKAIESMTNEGGKFGGLMEKQSHSITGQISNIEDTIEMAINDIGQQTEGVMNTSLDIVSTAIDHWKEIGEAIMTAAGAIGLYKAAAVAVATWDSNVANVGYDAEIKQLSNVFPETSPESKNKDLDEAVSTGALTEQKAALVAQLREEAAARVEILEAQAREAVLNDANAQENLNLAKQSLDAKSQEYDKAVEVAAAAQQDVQIKKEQYEYAKKIAEQAQEEFDWQQELLDNGAGSETAYDDASKALAAAQTQELATAEAYETAVKEANTAAEAVNTAETNLNTASDEVNAAVRAKQATATAADTANKEANTAAQNLNTASTARDSAAKGIWASVTTLCKQVQDAWNASMFASPLFWIAAVIAGVTYAVYKLATAESAHDAALRQSNEEWSEFDKKIAERQSNIENLIRTIQSEASSEFQKAEAYQKLSELAPQLTEKYDQAAIASLDFSKAQTEIAENMDKAKYDEAVANVEKYKQELEKLNQSADADAKRGGGNSTFYTLQIDQAKENLKQAEAVLQNINELQKQAVENAKPIEVKLKEAKENEKVRQEIFDFYDNAMLLASDWQSANEQVNFVTGETRLDKFISDTEDKIEELKKNMEKNPADVNLQLKQTEYQKILDGLVKMKSDWNATGATSIPLTFKTNWQSAEQALADAKAKAQAVAMKGKTYQQAYNDAKSDYNTKKAKVDKIKKNKSAYTADEYSTAVSQLEDSEKAFKALGGDVSKNRNKNTAADRERNRANTVTNAKDRLQETEQKNAQAREKEAKELERDLADARIEAMQEGAEKVLAQRKRELEKEIEQIESEKSAAVRAEKERQKAEFDARQAVVKAKGGRVTKWDESKNLDTFKTSAIEKKYNQLSQYKIDNFSRDQLKEVTDNYKTEAEKRLDIERKYNDDIAVLQEARAEQEKKLTNASSDNERDDIQKKIDKLTVAEGEAVKKKGEELVSFDFGQLKKNPEYVQAFENLKEVSSDTLTHLISLFEQYKEKAGETMNPDSLREYMNTFTQMQDELISRESPFKQVFSAAADVRDSESEVKSIQKYINVLDKQGEKTKDEITIEKKLSKVYKTREEAEDGLRKAKDKLLKREEKYRKAVQNLHTELNDLATSISSLGDTIGGTEGKILQLIGNVLSFVTTSSEGIQKVAATGTQAISTIEKASVILTIISAAIQLMQALDNITKDAHAQYEEYAAEIKEVNDLTDAVNEYTLAVMKATQEKEKWFATTDLIDLKDAYEYSGKALEQYYAKAAQEQAIYQNEQGKGWLTTALYWINQVTGWTTPFGLINKGLDAIGLGDNIFQKIANWTQASTGVAGSVESVLASYVKTLEYEEGTTAAINNLRIETQARTHGFLGTGLGAHSQKTQDLQSWVKENFGEDLFDENNLINVELANEVIEKYGDKLVGETKETLETLIDLRKKYDEFIEQLEEYVSDAFSPLTDDLTDALWDWLESGEDVMDKFKEYASDTFADIAKQIVKSAIVSNFFSQYQNAIEEAYKAYSMGLSDEKTLSSTVAVATQGLIETIGTNLPMLQELLRAMDEQFQQLGIAISGTTQSEQEATTAAIEAITADQASSLIGIGYAMQVALEQGNEVRTAISVDVSSMRAYTEQISNNLTEMRDIQYEGLGQLQQIAKNTAPISLIRDDISSMYKLMKERY